PEFPDALEFDNSALVERTLGYAFLNIDLLVEALSCSTAARKAAGELTYDRLEFLGDAVLDGLLLEYWENRCPDEKPKALARLTTDSATNNCLGAICIDKKLFSFMLGGSDAFWSEIHDSVLSVRGALSSRPTAQFWEHCRIDKCLGDLIEGIFGAVYVDSGFRWLSVKAVFNNLIAPVLDSNVVVDQLWTHPRNRLMNATQSICKDVCIKRVTKKKSHVHTFEVKVHGVTLVSASDSKQEWVTRLVCQQALDMLASDPKLIRRMCCCGGAQKRT
ncbi:hypothetical protein BGZ49_005063, partial [Haplosporangium sp. Z 27]